MIQAVIFDMDGVLFDTERISIGCWIEVAQQENMKDIDTVVYGCIGLNRADTAIYLKKCYGESFDVDGFRAKIHAAFLKRVEKEGIPMMKGVREILSYIKEKHIPAAIASSTKKETILQHLEETGLTDYFDQIIGGDMVKHSKPKPDIYLMACKALGVAPENAIAIEDSPNGIRSCYAAGMKAVMVPDMVVPTREIEDMLYRKCDSLLEVMELLQS